MRKEKMNDLQHELLEMSLWCIRSIESVVCPASDLVIYGDLDTFEYKAMILRDLLWKHKTSKLKKAEK